MTEHQPPIDHARVGTGEPVDEVSLVRSREQLSAVTQRVPVATARLEKFVVTEPRTIVVDVAREDVRLVYDTPPTTDNDAPSAVDDQSHPRADTVTLFAEEIEIVRRWVPVETARLDVATVTSAETVTDTVRTEHIDTAIGTTTPETGW